MAVSQGPGFATVEIVGMKKLGWQLSKLEDKNLAKELRQDYRAVAKLVAEEAKTGGVIPIETGKLAKSIGPITSRSSIGVKVGTEARVRYAGPIHYGWPKRGIPARKFLYAAINAKESEIEKLLEDGIRRAASKAGLTIGLGTFD